MKRQQDAALSTYRQNRDDLINFYKSLGQLSKKKIPKKLKEEDEGKEIDSAEMLLNQGIGQFSKTSLGLSPTDLDVSVGRLAIAMFLIERVKKIREFAHKNDNLSFFSLYVSLRNQVSSTLVEQYYSKTPDQVINDYLDAEPLLCACSDLCGLAVPPLGEIVTEYKKVLAERLLEAGKQPAAPEGRGKAAPAPEKRKTKKARKKTK